MGQLNKILTGAAFAVAAAGSASATVPLYGDVGHVNTTTYSFTATNTGDVVAYFAGSTARYDETLTMFVNGVATGIVGLDDHTSTVGQSLDFGHVQAGATLTFAINVLTNGNVWSSDESLNSDGMNHIYSAAYDGGTNGIPSGTYVAFEDLAAGHSDLNYHDETFVFTDVSTIATVNAPPSSGAPGRTQPKAPPAQPIVGQAAPPVHTDIPSPPPPTPSVSAVPEPATWAIMLTGFASLGAALRGRRRMALSNL